MAGGWDESGCAYPWRSRKLNTSIELRRVTKAHGDMRMGCEKSAEVIVPVNQGRAESWERSVIAGYRMLSNEKSTQRRKTTAAVTRVARNARGDTERLLANG